MNPPQRLGTSVIIPYRDRPIQLERTLRSIRNYSTAEVLVVDDGSASKAGAELASQFGAFYAELPHPATLREPWPFRLAAARNLGAALSSGVDLLFNDVDVSHERGLVDQVEEQALIEPLAIILPRLVYKSDTEGEPDRLSRPELYSQHESHDWHVSRAWLSAWMGFSFVPRIVFNAVGGFDQAYEGWGPEDMDFAYRAARQGFQFCYTSRGTGTHWPHPSQPDKSKRARANSQLFQEKHGFPLPCELIRPSGKESRVRV